MAKLKECIYFYVYSSSNPCDQIYNCTVDTSVNEYASYVGRIGMANDRPASLVELYQNDNIFGFRFDKEKNVLYVESFNKDLKAFLEKNPKIRNSKPVVTRIFSDMDLDKYYVVSAILASSLKKTIGPKFDDEFMVTYDLSDNMHKLPEIDQSTIFNNRIDLDFIGKNRKEYVELVRAFLYAQKNKSSLYISLGNKQYNTGCQYLDAIIKLLPINLANKVSFSTVYTGKDEDVSLFFQEHEDGEVRKHASYNVKNVVVTINNPERLFEGSYLKESDYSEISYLGDQAHYSEPAFKKFINDFVNTMNVLDTSSFSIEKVIEALLIYIHLFDNAEGDYSRIVDSVFEELKFVEKHYDYCVKELRLDPEDVCKRLIKLAKAVVESGSKVSDSQLEKLIAVRYKYGLDVFDDIIYNLIVTDDLGSGSNRLIDLMFNLELISENISKYREEYFNQKFLSDNLLKREDFIVGYLKSSLYSKGLLKLLKQLVCENAVNYANTKETAKLVRIIVDNVDKSFEELFLAALEKAGDNEHLKINAIQFFVDFIESCPKEEERDYYFDSIIKEIDKSYFKFLYTQLVNVKLNAQRKAYFLKSMGVELPVDEESEFVNSLKAFSSLEQGITNDVVRKKLIDDYNEFYIKDLDLSLILRIDLSLFADENLKLYELLQGVGRNVPEAARKKTFLENAKQRYKDYELWIKSKEESESLLDNRVDFIVHNLLTLGDKKAIRILNTYVGKDKVNEAFKDIGKTNEHKDFEPTVEKLAREFLESDDHSKATRQKKSEFAKDVIAGCSDKKLTARMSFKEVATMISNYSILLFIFASINLAVFLLFYFLVLKSNYMFLMLAVSFLNILAMSILFVKNTRLRMFRNPLLMTLWQSLIVTIIMFITLYGAIMIFAWL